MEVRIFSTAPYFQCFETFTENVPRLLWDSGMRTPSSVHFFYRRRVDIVVQQSFWWGARVRAFFVSIGWMLFRLLLGLPAWVVCNAALGPWRSYTDANLLPFLTPQISRNYALLITLGPLLALTLAMWVGTVKLTERLFHFRFPD